MQKNVRTTIRIRKDLLDLSRQLALNKGRPVQDVINDALAIGYKHITDLNKTKMAMKQIDNFRQSMENKKISLSALLKAGKSVQK